MPWWVWLVVGGGLMAVELTVADAAFYLVFIGAAAVIVGLAEAGGADLPVWAQWLAFGGLAVAGMVWFRERLYQRLRGGRAPALEDGVVGERVQVSERVAAGGRTRVAMRGSQWDAVNVGGADIAAGADAAVVGLRGNRLEIESDTKA